MSWRGGRLKSGFASSATRLACWDLRCSARASAEVQPSGSMARVFLRLGRSHITPG